MKRHVLSTAAIVAMVLLGSATSVIDEIRAEIRRTPDGISVTNLDDFAWEHASIALESDPYHLLFQAEIGTVAVGETIEVPFSEIKHRGNVSYSIEIHGNVQASVNCSAPSGAWARTRGAPFLFDLQFAE